ncbi:Ca-activated chloride channel family protein [Shimia sagamensis]|uniref:Ca-activated chloride channel family protein n=2 Tax=Shimia sagamensis TaxID=1566352 RepID=A0ABY1PAT4_9RHOB|nr:Ca-activated chloride channel family protein [Shimia sagamensis]
MACACDLALLLAVDVSGSVDATEYDIQMRGLAAGLRDGVVVEALIKAEAAVAVMQWTGADRQVMSVPWMRVRNGVEAEALAVAVDVAPRGWRRYSTAIGDALSRAAVELAAGPGCRRMVLDVSGDGPSNEGVLPEIGRKRLEWMGVTVNGLVIETEENDLTGYYWENVITGPGAFVVTANGFEEYPKRIRQKLMREVSQQLSELR